MDAVSDSPGGQPSPQVTGATAGSARVPDILEGEARCPLHFAMEQLAHAAVAQLVYYAHGEYLPRADLLRDLERWQRVHALIAERICPATCSAGASLASLCAALALIPEARFAAQREMLARCAARDRGDACPLEQASEPRLFDGE